MQFASPFAANKDFCTLSHPSEGTIPPELLTRNTISTNDRDIGICSNLVFSSDFVCQICIIFFLLCLVILCAIINLFDLFEFLLILQSHIYIYIVISFNLLVYRLEILLLALFFHFCEATC